MEMNAPPLEQYWVDACKSFIGLGPDSSSELELFSEIVQNSLTVMYENHFFIPFLLRCFIFLHILRKIFRIFE
jgi:hypothetical protein